MMHKTQRTRPAELTSLTDAPSEDNGGEWEGGDHQRNHTKKFSRAERNHSSMKVKKGIIKNMMVSES
jgi:hypothetical protein